MPAVVYGPAINHTIVLWNNAFNSTSIVDPSLGNRINMTDPATWSKFTPTATNPYVEYDIGREATLNAIGIAAHTLASSGASFRLQYQLDGVWTNAFTDYSPLTDEDILIVFPNARGQNWRIRFTGGGFVVGVAFAGFHLAFPHAPVDGYTPLHHARKYTKLFNDSVKGQFLGNRVLAAGAETSVDMGFFDRPWVENNIRGFENHFNRGGTFFYASSPSKYPLDVGYCRAAGDDETMNIVWTESDKLATVDFNIQSYVG